MMTQLSALLPGFDWSLVLVYLRIQAFVFILPALGEGVIPVRVRVAIGLSLAPLLGQIAPDVMAPTSPLGGMTQAAGEVVIGLATGSLLRVLALALDIATTAIAATASLSQIIGVQNEAAPHPIGNMLHLGGLAILMALGLPLMLVRLLADSLTVWPPASWPDIDALAHHAIQITARSFWLAMLLAAPFTLGGFLYQVLSGLISRVMPALPVMFIGAPAAILLALTALATLAPMLVALWADAVLGFTLPGPS